MSASEIVNKVWNYAHVLRALQNPFGFHQVFPELRSGHDGVGYGDYVEQITYLIFLKMADEREKAGQHFKTASGVLPQNCLRQFIRHFLRFAPVASSTS